MFRKLIFLAITSGLAAKAYRVYTSKRTRGGAESEISSVATPSSKKPPVY